VFYYCYLNFWIWFEFKKEITFEFKFGILIKSIGQSQFGPTGLLAQPAHSGSAKPTRLGSGSVKPTQPSPIRPLSLSLVEPSGELDRRRRRLAPPANPGGHRHRHLRRITRPSTPYQLHQVESPTASSPRGSGWSFPSGSAVSEHPRCGASPCWSLLSQLSLLRCLCLAVLAGWSVKVWCSRCGLGEDFPRQPLAGRAGPALPCHPDEHLGVWWALLLLLTTFCFSHWPWSLTMLVRTSEPSSQSLLCDAAAGCMFDSVSCNCAKSCDTLPAPLLPLSAYLLTGVLFLNLAHLQDSVSTCHILAILFSPS
jgi:hypothetical protein